jgi:tetratricopeptide (TPR) repeat protein
MEHIYVNRFTKNYLLKSSDYITINIVKKQFKKKILFFFLLIILVLDINAQKATMLFSKSMLNKTNKMISIELSDSSGTTNPSSEFFNQSEMIYFVVKPQEGQDWTLSRKDAEKKLIEIKLIQSINMITSAQPKIIMYLDEIRGVVLSYPKYQVSILKELKFKFDEVESDPIFIPEKLWPKYKKYSDIIINSQFASSNGDYINAFKTLTKLWNKDTLLAKFSFYNSAKDSLTDYSDKIIAQSTTQFSKNLDIFKSNITEQNLNQLFILKDSIFETLTFLNSFLDTLKNEIDAVSRLVTIETQKKNILSNLDKSRLMFRKKKLALFEEKTYQDYQLKVYSEAIAKVITSVDKIKQISSLDSINVAKIKSFPTINKEIIDMGWSNDFQSICKLLNENIIRFGYLFNDTAINNFSQNKLNEPQPYFALFKAINALVKKDKRLFIELVNQSMYAISDKDLLSSLDLYVALVNNEITNNDEYWELLQRGYYSQITGSLQEAKLSYDKAEKLSNSGEILFFLMAETNLKLGDRYSAEIYFERANTINPKFILPKLYQIEFLIEDKDYETALTLVNEALISNPIWYFYYKKALLLGLTGKFNESKLLLVNNCLTLNPLNYDQYLVLGDVNNALGDAKSARECYMKAGNIKPNDNGYKNRMENLKQSQEVKPIK